MDKFYRVSFPFNNSYFVAGYTLSEGEPIEEDLLEIMSMSELRERAFREKALKLDNEGKIKSMDDLWNAYTECRINPSLIKCSPLSIEESKRILFNETETM